MSTLWTHRTKTGRIVYDRKKHYWTEKDLLRIYRHLYKRKTEEKGPAEDKNRFFQFLINLMMMIATDLVSWILSPIGLQALARELVWGLWNAIDSLRELVMKLMMSRFNIRFGAPEKTPKPERIPKKELKPHGNPEDV